MSQATCWKVKSQDLTTCPAAGSQSPLSFALLLCADQFYGPPSLKFSGKSRLGMKLTTCLNLLLRLKMLGARPLPHHTST